MIINETFKPRLKPIFLIAASFCLVLYFVDKDFDKRGFFAGSICIALMAIIFYLVLSRITITVDQHGITHKTLLRKKEISWSDIIFISHDFHYHGHSGNNQFSIRLANKRSYTIVTDFFSRDCIQKLSIAFEEACKGKIDDKIQKMALGKFPWYVF